MTDVQPRRFHLQRDTDISGVSGTGRVADGVLWSDGTVSIRWTGPMPSTVFWHSLANALHVHGHGGATRIVWDDPEPPVDDYPMADDCEHCPDGHTPPDHGQPWGAFIGPQRDGDGQPIQINVVRSGGAHVAESDADWVRARLNGPVDVPPAPIRESAHRRLGRGA